MNPIRKWRQIGFAIAGVVFALDQLLKWIVVGPLGLEYAESMPLLPIFSLTRTHNLGVSFGMLTAESLEMRVLLILVLCLIVAGVVVWMLREKALADIAALGLVLGGALGNILDRARLGHVLDFADLHFGEWRPFLIFNLADAAITIGVLIVLARSLFMREKPADTQQPDPDNQAADNAAETH